MTTRAPFLFFLIITLTARSQTIGVRNWNALYRDDWLVHPVQQKAVVYKIDDKNIVLFNGLVKRVFRISPNVVCTDFKNMITGQQLIRAVMPEAVIVINEKTYNIGGLYGQKEKAYLIPASIDSFSNNPNDFQFISYTTGEIKPFVNWNYNGWWASNTKQPTGKILSLMFRHNSDELKHIIVKVHYAIYDGIPLIAKWVTIENGGAFSFKINRVKNEVLALVEEESAVVGKPEHMQKQQGIYVETNYAFNNAMRYEISDQTMHWKIDSSYTSQVNYNYDTPCVLEVYPDKAPGIELQPGGSFTSVRSFELLMDSYDRERRGLAIRRMYSTI